MTQSDQEIVRSLVKKSILTEIQGIDIEAEYGITFEAVLKPIVNLMRSVFRGVLDVSYSAFKAIEGFVMSLLRLAPFVPGYDWKNHKEERKRMHSKILGLAKLEETDIPLESLIFNPAATWFRVSSPRGPLFSKFTENRSPTIESLLNESVISSSLLLEVAEEEAEQIVVELEKSKEESRKIIVNFEKKRIDDIVFMVKKISKAQTLGQVLKIIEIAPTPEMSTDIAAILNQVPDEKAREVKKSMLDVIKAGAILDLANKAGFYEDLKIRENQGIGDPVITQMIRDAISEIEKIAGTR